MFCPKTKSFRKKLAPKKQKNHFGLDQTVEEIAIKGSINPLSPWLRVDASFGVKKNWRLQGLSSGPLNLETTNSPHSKWYA